MSVNSSDVAVVALFEDDDEVIEFTSGGRLSTKEIELLKLIAVHDEMIDEVVEEAHDRVFQRDMSRGFR